MSFHVDIDSHTPRPCFSSHSFPLGAAKDGSAEAMTDEDLESKVIALTGANVTTTFISTPADASKTLGIKLPWLVLLMKNLDDHFSLEVQILDDKKIKRRFRASTFQASLFFPSSSPTAKISFDATERPPPS